MPCIAQGARGGLARIKHRLYYSSWPLDAEDRTAKCKSRAAKKAQGVGGDRQAALSPMDRTSVTENKLQLPPCTPPGGGSVFTCNVLEPGYSMILNKPGLNSYLP